MPDKPSASSDAVSGASVLHEALLMRREVERELAEAGEIRAAALVEATGVLEQARLAAAGLEEEAAAEARETVNRAREQALGIVAQSREEAEALLGEAHAEAAQYEMWARQQAHDRLALELSGLHESIAERRDDLESTIPALQVAIERALVSLDAASWLGASWADRASLPDQGLGGDRPHDVEADLSGFTGFDRDEHADGHHGHHGHQPEPEPEDRATRAQIRLVTSDGDHLHGDHLRRPAPDDDDGSTGSVPVDVEEASEVTEVTEVTETTEVAEVAEVAELSEVEVGAVTGTDDTPVAEARRRRDHDGRVDDDARPLGWLFRSPPMP